MASLYKLTDGDRAIFAATKTNPNFFTDYYLRSPTSGTWWREVDSGSKNVEVPEIKALVDRWERGYERLFDEWSKIGKPEQFEYANRKYNAVEEAMGIAFHDHHGILFLDWQIQLWHAMQPTGVILGGYGCLGGETRVFDVERNEHIPIADLYHENRQPVVLAWTGSRFVPTRANKPYIKGRKALYRIRTRFGREMVVTEDHVFLTAAGWQRLVDVLDGDDLRLVGCDPSLQGSIEALCPSMSLQDARHWKRTIPGSRYDYPAYLHFYGEQLRLWLDNDQYVVPSQDDVCEHNPHDWHMDALVQEQVRSQIYQSSDHHSKHYSSRHVEAPWGSPVESPWLSDNDVFSRDLSGAFQWPQESPYTSFPDQYSYEFDPDMDQTVRSVSYSPVYQESSSIPLLDYDIIEEVAFLRDDVYYDFTVPRYHNYVAEGIIHHNSGKSWGEMLNNMIRMATLRQFRAFVLAPFQEQAKEIFDQVLNTIADTEYAKRFLIAAPRSPRPKLIIGNDLVGESTMEFYPINENPEKVLNLSGDVAHIEQAEQLEEIQKLIRLVGSRFRGRVGGRERLGLIRFIANAEDNTELWDLVDEAEEDPAEILYLAPSTFDNIHNTPRQLKIIAKRMGSDPNIRASALKGARPIGSGEHFPHSAIAKCRADWLDDLMADGLKRELSGFHRVEAPKAGVVEWTIPPMENGIHLLVADPGWANPPERNSAAIMVFEITDFPTRPAHLRAFAWVYGNGSPDPWLQKYAEYCIEYNCVSRNAFDATGPQAGYERWVHGLHTLLPTPYNFGGVAKFVALNTTKKMINNGLLTFPNLPMLFNQMTKYKLPDDKIRQDLVMAVLVACNWLEQLYYEAGEGETDVEEEDTRWKWHESRYRGRVRA